MRWLTVAAVSALALGAAACGPRVDYAARTRLDCPDRQGSLTRVSAAADGKSCLYRSDDLDVTLQLTPVSGGAAETLKEIEASLVGPQGGELQPPAPPAPPAAPAAATPGDAARAAQQAAADAGAAGGGKGEDWSTGDHVEVRKAGKNVHIDTGDDHAHVNLPGLHIDADDNGAKVDVAGIHIDANDTNATIRMMRDVRLRGHPFARQRNGVRATFIAHRENLPGGYRVVGYEASGPKSGPLTVAIIRSHNDINDSGGLYGDVKRLVRRNGGA
jgi:hypothetical protein